MTDSGHNRCRQCGVFVGIGGMYGHYWVDHEEFWNDHAIARMDMCALKRVEEREMERAEKGERERERGRRVRRGRRLALRQARIMRG
jgi:hypothetical protein